MLMRAFSKVDDDGRIAVGRQFWRQLRLTAPASAALYLVRLKGSKRKPYLSVCQPGSRPRLNDGLERIAWEGPGTLDQTGRLCLGQRLTEHTCFVPGSKVEIKLAGTSTWPRLAIRWQGPVLATTLQQRMNVRGLAAAQQGGHLASQPAGVDRHFVRGSNLHELERRLQ